MFFRDIDPDAFRGKLVFLDIDGTLVPNGESELLPPESSALSALAERADIFLVSNHGIPREPALVARYGIKAIVSPHKKPSVRVLEGVSLPDAPRIVIGDKVLTDGWFAKRIGAEFVRVKPLWGRREQVSIRLMYALDSIVWFFVPTFAMLFASTAWEYVRLARPKQWVKNFLILAPLFFGGGFFSLALLLRAVSGMIAFSFAASAGYVLNDILDRREDALHPTKRNRPVASGAISPSRGILFALALLALALFAASIVPEVIPWLVLYFALQYLYSSALRAIPVLEFIVVASFFVLRILAGGAIVNVPISGWLLLTTFFAALFVTTGKRYSESCHEGVRAVVRSYPPIFLQILPAVSAVLAIVAYALYSVLGTPHPLLVFTNLFVVFGILWYLRGIYLGVAEEPETKLWSDVVLLLTVAAWGLSLLLIFYSVHPGMPAYIL